MKSEKDDDVTYKPSAAEYRNRNRLTKKEKEKAEGKQNDPPPPSNPSLPQTTNEATHMH